MVKGFACRTEFQNAVGVCPESVRPDRSVMVPEIHQRHAADPAVNSPSMPKIAALALSVSKSSR